MKNKFFNLVSCLLKKQNEMSIAGQGGIIILFAVPVILAAGLTHLYLPRVAGLPSGWGFLRLLGALWLIPGLTLWGRAVVQLIRGWSGGKLVTTGAYGVTHNPIYSSAAFFFLPAASLLTLNWVYLAAAAWLCAGVHLFIGKEEQQLRQAFDREYEDYLKRTPRLVPFTKP